MTGNESDSDDPLENAPIGETTTQQFEQTLDCFGPLYREFGGSDRDFDADVADIEVVDTGYGTPEIQVTWEADVTKTLPRHWFSLSRTPSESSSDLHSKLSRYDTAIVSAGTIAFTSVVVAVITNNVLESMAGTTINGEPITVPPDVSIWLAVFSAGIFLWIIRWAVSGGLPPQMGVRR